MKNQAELRNCPQCNGFFNYTGIRDLCGQCAAKEEKIYEEVSRFLRKRENRTATIEQIVDETGVTKELLHKWVRKGRLQPSMFPNLGYPCEKCGELTKTGKICVSCSDTLQSDLRQHEAVEEIKETVNKIETTTYYNERKRN